MADSETPETDAEKFNWTDICGGEAPDGPAIVVDADKCADLERRLREAEQRSQEHLCEMVDVIHKNEALINRVKSAERALEALKRGEFICQKCGIRKDGEYEPADF